MIWNVIKGVKGVNKRGKSPVLGYLNGEHFKFAVLLSLVFNAIMEGQIKHEHSGLSFGVLNFISYYE